MPYAMAGSSGAASSSRRAEFELVFEDDFKNVFKWRADTEVHLPLQRLLNKWVKEHLTENLGATLRDPESDLFLDLSMTPHQLWEAYGTSKCRTLWVEPKDEQDLLPSAASSPAASPRVTEQQPAEAKIVTEAETPAKRPATEMQSTAEVSLEPAKRSRVVSSATGQTDEQGDCSGVKAAVPGKAIAATKDAELAGKVGTAEISREATASSEMSPSQTAPSSKEVAAAKASAAVTGKETQLAKESELAKKDEPAKEVTEEAKAAAKKKVEPAAEPVLVGKAAGPPAKAVAKESAKKTAGKEAAAKEVAASVKRTPGVGDTPTGDDPIEFEDPNPKNATSASGLRYAKYMKAKTVQEALKLGAAKGDIAHDFKKGYLRRRGAGS